MILTRSTRLIQPQGPVEVSPEFGGRGAVYLPNVRSGIALVAGTVGRALTPQGISATYTAGAETKIERLNGSAPNGITEFTQIIYLTPLAGGVVNDRGIFGNWNTTGATGLVQFTHRARDASSNGKYCYVFSYDPTSAAVSAGTRTSDYSAADGAPALLIAVVKNNTLSLYLNGVKHGSTSVSAVPMSSQADLQIGNYYDNTYGRRLSANVHLAAFLPSGMGDAEVAALSRNPWQLFRPVQRRTYFDMGAGGGGTSTVSSDLLSSYDIRGAVTADSSHDYSVRGAVAAPIGTAYDIRGATSADIAASYAVRGSAGTESDVSYAIRGTAHATTSPAYDIRGSVFENLGAVYDIRGSVLASLSASYDVRGSAAANLGASYAVRGSAITDLPASYTVRGSAGADSDVSYAVRGAVHASASPAYDIRGSVTSDLSAAYDILSATSVVSDSACAYSIRGTTYATTSPAYGIRGAAVSDLPAAYDIRSATFADLSAAYAIEAGVSSVYADLTTSYFIDGAVHSGGLSPSDLAAIRAELAPELAAILQIQTRVDAAL